jgi:translation initiation factor 1
MICKFEKEKEKSQLYRCYDFKILAKEIKTKLSVGGTFNDSIIKEITELWKY